MKKLLASLICFIAFSPFAQASHLLQVDLVPYGLFARKTTLILPLNDDGIPSSFKDGTESTFFFYTPSDDSSPHSSPYTASKVFFGLSLTVSYQPKHGVLSIKFSDTSLLGIKNSPDGLSSTPLTKEFNISTSFLCKGPTNAFSSPRFKRAVFTIL
jgi:hypothetical protein